MDRNGLSVSTETACRFEPKSPVGNSEICVSPAKRCPPPSSRGSLDHRRADRWTRRRHPVVCGGVDAGADRKRMAAGRGQSLRVGPAGIACDPAEPACFAAGAARPARSGREGGRANRRGRRPRILLSTADCGRTREHCGRTRERGGDKGRDPIGRPRPLVSGSADFTNRNPSTQITAYSQNVPAGPSQSLRNGNVRTSTKQATHNADTAAAIASPRIRFGKISEITTHTTGAKVIE